MSTIRTSAAAAALLCAGLLLAAGKPLSAATNAASGGLEHFTSRGNVVGFDNTFLGGGGLDEGASIAVDSSGYVYVAGASFTAWGSPVLAHAAASDAFVAKLTPDGELIWNTFLGGSGDDFGQAIAVDGSGNVYVAGSSTAPWGSPVIDYAGGTADAFTAKLTADGALVWNTFLGGTNNDQGFALALDDSDVYVAGSSFETWGSPVRDYTGSIDAFAAKLTANGALAWNTFLGGADGDQAFAIAVDSGGNVHVAGDSISTWGSPVRAHTASTDAFAAALTAAGTLSWNTFLGGSGDDSAGAILVDGGGNIYLAGRSTDTWDKPERAYTAATDAFAARLTTAGKLTWNTFLGGSGDDAAASIAFDGSDIYVAGNSAATWDKPVRAYTDSFDAFAARLTVGGTLVWNTFLGDKGVDVGYAVAVDGLDIYMTGHSDGTWSDPLRAYTASPEDAFVTKIPVDSSVTAISAATSK